MRNRPTRKSRGKFCVRGKQQAEESEKNPEDQLSRAGDAGGHVPGQEDWAEGPAEKLRQDSRPCVEGEAVQNGPSGPSPAPVGGSVGLASPEPGEDAGVEVAPGPAAAERP